MQPRDVQRNRSLRSSRTLRRLADALESEKPFRVQVAGERIRVPPRAEFSIEPERDEDSEEIEFQLTWNVTDVHGDEDKAAGPV